MVAQTPLSRPSVQPLLTGARRMSSFNWDQNISPWMYGSVHDPEIVFHQLKMDDKEVLMLLRLMISESAKQIAENNSKGVDQLTVRLIQISDAQEDHQGLMRLLLVGVAIGGGGVYVEYNRIKANVVEVCTNVFAHSPEIFSAAIDAGKYGSPWIMGKLFGNGKPWKFDPEWLEPPKEPSKESKFWNFLKPKESSKDTKDGGGDAPPPEK